MTKATVAHVKDGDTFLIYGQISYKKELFSEIRPRDYDAVELTNSDGTTNQIGKKAKEWLSDLILYKKVDLSNFAKDPYNRLICDVKFGGKMLGDLCPDKYKKKGS